jgi:hypothetical protein
MMPTAARGQGQFGGQVLANLAEGLFIGPVQQAFSTLSPLSPQSVEYRFDPELLNFVRSEHLGPTSFRSPWTVGKNEWAVHASYSYFELENEFGPDDYLLSFDKNAVDPISGEPFYIFGVTAFGLEAKATVNLVNLGFNYGITDRLEFELNVPISIVKAQASQISSAIVATDGTVTMEAGAVVGFFPTNSISDQEIGELEEAFDASTSSSCDPQSGNCIAFRTDSFNSLGFDFNNDTSPGVGRISLGAKYLFYAGEYANLAASLEFFNPSPSEDEFAGSESPAILPRVIAEIPVREIFRIHLDAGYDYDFEHAQFRRFVWNAGVSVPIARYLSVDFGAGGSEFDEGALWSRKVTTGSPITAAGLGLSDATPILTAQGDTELGTSFIDFLAGFKIRVWEEVFLTGAVTTPLTNDGFRADATGTVGVQSYH